MIGLQKHAVKNLLQNLGLKLQIFHWNMILIKTRVL